MNWYFIIINGQLKNAFAVHKKLKSAMNVHRSHVCTIVHRPPRINWEVNITAMTCWASTKLIAFSIAYYWCLFCIFYRSPHNYKQVFVNMKSNKLLLFIK